MQVSVTFRHMDSSDPLRDYATEKVLKTTKKYLRRPEEAHVILSATKRLHDVEITIHAKHFDVAAHSANDDCYAAIDGAMSKLEAQLRKHHDRLNDHKGKRAQSISDPTMVPVEVFAPVAEDDEGPARVVESENIPAKPLSVEDAILQLELRHAEFLVFRNSGTDSISVLYRRRDGNYGLISPNA